MSIILFALMACGSVVTHKVDSQQAYYELDQDLYDWSCNDYENQSDLFVWVDSCDIRQEDLQHLTARCEMNDYPKYAYKMDKVGDCSWEMELSTENYHCINIIDVMVTAWYEDI